ncbi:MAG: PEP-CTERM sorting domain-containing protein [Phycisphaeraceae bacterium]
MGPARPTFDSELIDLSGALYQNLTNTTVFFQWYAGGTGSGDIDIDNIVISGMIVQVPEPATATLGLLGLAGLMARRRRVA